ncbi:MAG: CPBP family intramembrane metalloprotease [Clostridia bacterium]|nr:CPBP family intramembrane metalloprotease [Clostridia bacterium]
MKDRKQRALTPYLLWAFLIAWALQIAAGPMYRKGNHIVYTALLSLSMFAPMLAALLSGAGLRGMGWKPRLRGKLRWVLAAWFGPAILGTAGAALYFLLVPQALDLNSSYIRAALGEEQIALMEAGGLTLPQYALSSCIAALTYAPLINMGFAIGEEAGWRGVMYPELKRRYGTVKGRIVGGVIWGIWHWPIMLLAGYEYGTSYWGAPVTGPLLFCLIASAMGIVVDVLYDQTDCIWMPALCHGAINAFAGVPTLVLNPAYANGLLLGPLMVGLIGGLPMILLAAAVCIRDARKAGRVS